MKRQRGRNRGGGGGGGGGKPQHNANRAFDSNGPDGVKVRGNAQHVFEKYQQLARDANAAGDRVLGENYLQHAEHYFRLIRAIQPNRPASEIIGRDQFASGYDIDFEDENAQAQAEAADEAGPSEPVEARQDGGERNRDRDRDRPDRGDRDRGDRDRGEWQPRDGDSRRDRDQNRDQSRDRDQNRDQNRDRDQGRDRDGRDRDRYRDRDRNRDRDRRDDRPRGDDGERRDRERTDRDRNDRDRDVRDPLAVVTPQGDAPVESRSEPRPESRAESRPEPRTRSRSETRGPMLRDSEGGSSDLPDFLRPVRAPAASEAEDEKPARPRRRRAPRSFDAGEGAPPSESEDA